MAANQEEILIKPVGLKTQTEGIDWDAYATQYDLMAKYNPSYRENIDLLRSAIERWDIPKDATICDLGGGTGNYIAALSKTRPDAEYHHVDFDHVMNEIAREKYAKIGLSKVSVYEEYIQRIDFPEQKFDLVICINALYAVSPQEAILRKISRWLKPNGIFFIIDFGRRNRMIDWSWFVLKNLAKERGLVECAKLLFNSVETIKQNNRGSKNQDDGTYWLHSTQEFGQALTDIGFSVEELRPCYRDYCDLAICRVSVTENQPQP